MGAVILDKNSELMEQLVEFGFSPEGARRAIADWERGDNLRMRQAIREQEEVSRANAQAAHRGVDGVGQCVVRIAASLQHAIREKYGEAALQDEKFMQGFAKRNGMEFKPAYDRKIMVTV